MAGGTRKKILEAEKLLDAERWGEARLLYRAVLSKRPDDVRALTGCAQSALQLGDFDEAEKLLSKAKRARPDDALVLVGMGCLHGKRGEFAEALRSFQSALKEDPQCAPALMEAGLVYLAIFQPDRAVVLLRRALAQDANNTRVMQALGDACQQLGRWNDAVDYYEDARRNGRENVTLLYNLATVYRAVGRFDEAESVYRETLDLQGNFVEAQAGLAELYETTGRHDKARRIVDEFANDLKKPIAPFGNVVTRLARRSGKIEEAITFLQRSLTEQGLSKENRAQLFFQLGSLYEYDERWDDAFNSYRQANSLFPKSFDADGYDRFIDGLISAFSPERLAEYPRSENVSELPVFIVGMPRSGTSLVEQIVAAHPLVYGAGELDILSRLVASLSKRLHSREPYPTCLGGLTAGVIEALSSDYLRVLGDASRAVVSDNTDDDTYQRITDKMPHNFTHMGLISLMFPRARVIHCTRNPIDTCFSCYATSLSATHSYANSLEDLVSAYRAYERLMMHWGSVLDPTMMMEVSYESLVENTESGAKALMEFLGLPWDEGCLSFHENERITLTASQDQVSRPVYTTSISRAAHFREHLGVLYQGLSSCE